MKRPLTRGDVLALAAVLAVTTVLVVHWAPHSFWSPDALLYQTRVEQIRGASEEEAIAHVWEGPLAAGFRAGDAQRALEDQALADPDWIPYHYDLFGRRLLVPLFAALIDPIAGTDSLEVVAILGVFAFALLLYALVRQRFTPLACGIAVTVCLLWPPMRWAFMPLTESWALALICAALLAALFAVERGREWLWVWGAAVLALGFTRDLTPVALGAAGLLMLTLRNRRSVELGVIGLLAALVAPLIAGASLRGHASFGFSGSRIAEDSGWGYVIERYFSGVESAFSRNFEYLFDAEPRFLEEGLPLFPMTLPILAGVLMVLLVRSDRSDVFLPLMRGAMLGGIAYLLLLPGFHALRYELVFLPVAAAGMAAGIDLLRWWARGAARESTALETRADRTRQASPT